MLQLLLYRADVVVLIWHYFQVRFFYDDGPLDRRNHTLQHDINFL